MTTLIRYLNGALLALIAIAGLGFFVARNWSFLLLLVAIALPFAATWHALLPKPHPLASKLAIGLQGILMIAGLYIMTEVLGNKQAMLAASAQSDLILGSAMLIMSAINVALIRKARAASEPNVSRSKESAIPIGQQAADKRESTLASHLSPQPASPAPPLNRVANRAPEGTSEVPAIEVQERFWSAALTEFEGATRRAGVWAKAFSEAQGNEATAKASYLRCRSLQLEEEHRAGLAAQQREAVEKETERVTQLRKLQALEAERIYQALPKGRCPNSACNAVIPLSSEGCAKCGAVFDRGAVWNVRP